MYRRGRWIGALLLVAVAGCSGSQSNGQGAPSAVPYVEMPEAMDGLRRERIQGVMECMEEQGFSGAILEDGTTSHEVAPGQEDAFDRASVACRKEVFPDITKPPTEDALIVLFRYQVETRKCLAELGIAVSDPPTLEVFLASRDEERWSPYREAHRAIAAEGQREVEEACPDPQNYLAYWR